MDQERWRKVQGLLHAALGLEAEARHKFLSVACGGDIDLQLQVELLLAKEEEAGCFLETPAARYPTVTPTITLPLLGRQFGPTLSNRLPVRLRGHGCEAGNQLHDERRSKLCIQFRLPPC